MRQPEDHLLAPGQDIDFDEWYGFDDALDYLEDSLGGSVALYLALASPHTRIYLTAVLIPVRELTLDAREDLRDWNINVLERGWGYGWSTSEEGQREYQLFPPFSGERPEILQKAVPIVWRRENSLTKDRPTYFEANPEVTHVHDLHWVKERSAYCTLDSLGDVREVVRVVRDPEDHRVTRITIEDDVLAKHMALGDYALVRFFDLDRFEDADRFLSGRPQRGATREVERRSLRARRTLLPGSDGEPVGARLRGVQLAPPPRGADKERLLDERGDREYVRFIAHDFKHKRVAEVSCAPDELDSYFEDTGKPLETTPAFFRREVLARYQANSDKYTVTDRQISCRSSWSIRYDVNDAGQVHAYLCDLQNLPYAEQQYWKSFNEAPKAPISERSFKTDFEGSWDIAPEPLRDLKARLGGPLHVDLSEPDRSTIWLPPPNRHTIDDVQYLAGESRKEWADAVGALHRLVVEGLQENELRKLAVRLGQAPDDVKSLRSIKLIERVLPRLGLEDAEVSEIVEPLGKLHHIRSKTASHRTGTEGERIIQEARREHGDLARHFKALVRDVDDAVQRLRAAVYRTTGESGSRAGPGAGS